MLTLPPSYAGWIGTVAARYKKGGVLQEEIPDLEESGRRLAVIAGTSTCHIVQVSSPLIPSPGASRVKRVYRAGMASSWMVFGDLIRILFLEDGG